MYKYSKRSKSNLSKCHIDLQLICHELLKIFDHSVIWGFRNKEDQELMVRRGSSDLHFPKSKHNKIPSMAVDLAPYPIDWDDEESFVFMGGLFLGIAYCLQERKLITHEIIWGGNWKSRDLGHFELKEV